jgi:hypothetical protein
LPGLCVAIFAYFCVVQLLNAATFGARPMYYPPFSHDSSAASIKHDAMWEVLLNDVDGSGDRMSSSGEDCKYFLLCVLGG